MPDSESSAAEGGRVRVAIVHDYVTQRGGAERVVLDLLRAFPEAELYTTVYDPAGTYPEFAEHVVHRSGLDRLAVLRHHHRLGLPFYAAAFSRMHVPADVVICSSSGWSHGVRTSGRKLVYCHNPARWLYQSSQYLDQGSLVAKQSQRLLGRALKRWDAAAAASADVYVANSTVVAKRIAQVYGRQAEVVFPPAAVHADGAQSPVAAVHPGFVLCVARLQPYKNVDAVIRAVRRTPEQRLVVVGRGPDLERLRSIAGSETTFLDGVSDGQLRWLYAHCVLLAAASYEDYGLTPLEAGAFGKPVVVLRAGGFLDTVREGINGLFFDQPTPESMAPIMREALHRDWNQGAIADHLEGFSAERFAGRMRAIAAELCPAIG